MLTKGTKNIINSDTLKPTEKFWRLFNLAKAQSPEMKVRTQEEMIYIAKECVLCTSPEDKWFEVYDKYASAYIATNGYGKKLWIKFQK